MMSICSPPWRPAPPGTCSRTCNLMSWCGRFGRPIRGSRPSTPRSRPAWFSTRRSRPASRTSRLANAMCCVCWPRAFPTSRSPAGCRFRRRRSRRTSATSCKSWGSVTAPRPRCWRFAAASSNSFRPTTEANLGRRPDGAGAHRRQDGCMGELGTARLGGKVALITGASRGLGQALAMAFAREGAALALCARGASALDEVARAVVELGGEVLAVSADLRSSRDLERLVALTLDRFHRVDILVNNASELGPTPLPYLADYPPAAFEDVLKVNLVTPFRLTQSVIGGMLLRNQGVVINVTSDAAVTGYPGWGAYAVSKAALEGLTRTWSAELAGTGLRMYAVDPGDMDTDMHRAAIPDADPSELARPDDVAHAFIKLVTSAESALAGQRVEAAALGR